MPTTRRHRKASGPTQVVLLATLSLLLLGGGGPSDASGCDDGVQQADHVVACGETTLRGSSTAMVRVSLPEEARLHAEVSPTGGVRIDGQGRFVGVVLAVDAPNRNAELVLAGRTSVDYGSTVRTASFSIDQDQDGRWNLPAGDYLFYLLADGSPAEVTLIFEGLEGSTTILPQTPAPYDIREPAFKNYGAPLPTGYAAIDEHEVGTHALAGRFLRVVPDTHAAGLSGLCFWEGAPPEDADSQPLCPGATLENRATPGPLESGYVLTGVTRGLTTGTYAQGAYVQDVSLPSPSDMKLLTFWLELTG